MIQSTPQHRACLTAGLQDPTIPQVPFEDKLHAIAYINSNCEAESGRSDLLRALMKLGDNAKVCLTSRVTLTSSVLSGCWRAEAMVDCCATLYCGVMCRCLFTPLATATETWSGQRTTRQSFKSFQSAYTLQCAHHLDVLVLHFQHCRH